MPVLAWGFEVDRSVVSADSREGCKIAWKEDWSQELHDHRRTWGDGWH